MRIPFHFCLLLCVLSASCALHTVRDDVMPEMELPQQFSGTGEVIAEERWWLEFNEPELDRLMEAAFSQNLDLKSAWMRLEQAMAVARRSGADLYPTLNLNASAGRAHAELPRTTTVNQLSFGFGGSYEVDLWKRIESFRTAAEFDALATRENVKATALALSGQVARIWFLIVEQQAQLQLLREQEDVNRTFLELNELRFSMGRATAADVFQQRTQLASVQAQIPRIESRLQVTRNQLAVLLGQPPYTVPMQVENLFPGLPPMPHTGLPLALLYHRPDVIAARMQLIAADYRVGSAIANQYPALRLTGQTHVQGEDLGDLFSNWFWNLAAGVMQPILDGGLRQAEVERSQAALRERLIGYEQAILRALLDVENALIEELKQREHLVLLEHEIELAENTLDSTHARYINGLSEYLPVLTALQNLQNLQRTYIAAQRELFHFRVNLYEALGGTWMEDLKTVVTDRIDHRASGDK